jgi:hypothetical protein
MKVFVRVPKLDSSTPHFAQSTTLGAHIDDVAIEGRTGVHVRDAHLRPLAGEVERQRDAWRIVVIGPP